MVKVIGRWLESIPTFISRKWTSTYNCVSYFPSHLCSFLRSTNGSFLVDHLESGDRAKPCCAGLPGAFTWGPESIVGREGAEHPYANEHISSLSCQNLLCHNYYHKSHFAARDFTSMTATRRWDLSLSPSPPFPLQAYGAPAQQCESIYREAHR